MAVNSFIGLPAAATLPIVSALPILRPVFGLNAQPLWNDRLKTSPHKLLQSKRLLDFEVWPPDTAVAPKRIECCRRNFGE